MVLNEEKAKGILESRSVISEANKYRVTVKSVQPHLVVRGNTTVVAIANFNAMNTYQAENSRKLFAEGDYDGACKKTLSLGIRDKDYMPSKGEIVDIIVEEVDTKEGLALLVTSMSPVRAVTKLNKFSFGSSSTEEIVAEEEDFAQESE